jgi:hypothetical protein
MRIKPHQTATRRSRVCTERRAWARHCLDRDALADLRIESRLGPTRCPHTYLSLTHRSSKSVAPLHTNKIWRGIDMTHPHIYNIFSRGHDKHNNMQDILGKTPEKNTKLVQSSLPTHMLPCFYMYGTQLYTACWQQVSRRKFRSCFLYVACSEHHTVCVTMNWPERAMALPSRSAHAYIWPASRPHDLVRKYLKCESQHTVAHRDRCECAHEAALLSSGCTDSRPRTCKVAGALGQACRLIVMRAPQSSLCNAL